MGRTACTDPQRLYKGAFTLPFYYLNLKYYSLSLRFNEQSEECLYALKYALCLYTKEGVRREKHTKVCLKNLEKRDCLKDMVNGSRI